MKKDPVRTHCIRCGQCCLSSSPTLQKADISLIQTGRIKKRDLYTIRNGELIYDNINHRHTVSDSELIKVREKEGGRKGCIYYDEENRACLIYDQRPLQCRALACWDNKAFLKAYASPKLKRKDLVEDKILLGLIAHHEQKCGYRGLEELVRGISTRGEKAIQGILELLRFDHSLRPFVSEKTGIDPRELDFAFGRPLTETIVMFGLEVRKESDGSFLLSVIQQASNPE